MSALGWNAHWERWSWATWQWEWTWSSASRVNLSDIQRNAVIGDKRMHGITCEGDLAYLELRFPGWW